MHETFLLTDLPIVSVLAQITQALADKQAVVLRAPPGAGKTTSVPLALLDANLTDGKILLIQPRRLAARAAASRLAKLTNSSLGEAIGYQVRFDNRTSKNTRLIAMTTGILLRRLQSDPLLEDVGCVILDEFHERSVEIDIALGTLSRIRQSLRPELQLVVMSATLDPEPIVAFLGDAVGIQSEGRSYPVDIRYSKTISREPIENQVLEKTQEAISTTDGNLLVFLPGVGEIHRCHRALKGLSQQHSLKIHELYGDLTPDKQDAVLATSRDRKIILATNVAETSITIEDVTCVIDTGVARVMQVESRLGLPKLQKQPISQASADQRAGRAGRTAPGIAYRLWPAASHRSRSERDKPEIERCDFSQPLLILAAWGEWDPFDFPWLTQPTDQAVELARGLLQRLGAIDASGSITAYGQRMLEFPLPPRLARFMLSACDNVCTGDASIVAALLTERDPFRGSGLPLQQRIELLHDFENGSRGIENVAAARAVIRVAKQIRRLVPPNPHQEPVSVDNAIAKSLLAAYPDRVARVREGDANRGVMVGGRGIRFDRSLTHTTSDLRLCLDVDSAGQEASVRIALPILEPWLDRNWISQRDVPFFDSSLQAVVARRRRQFDDLVLSESPIQCTPSDTVCKLLADAARPQLNRILSQGSKDLKHWIARVKFLTDQTPQLGLPSLDDGIIDDTLMALCLSRTKIVELEKAPWLDHLRAHFSYQQSQMIEKHAPSRFALPSGNSVAIHYDEVKPRMEVRIQEMFGIASTPRVAGGQVPITLHLLGPNYRPQQITEDLENFWAETYGYVRKELRGRYPKHHWPEDPTTAKATPRGLKPKQT